MKAMNPPDLGDRQVTVVGGKEEGGGGGGGAGDVPGRPAGSTQRINCLPTPHPPIPQLKFKFCFLVLGLFFFLPRPVGKIFGSSLVSAGRVCLLKGRGGGGEMREGKWL